MAGQAPGSGGMAEILQLLQSIQANQSELQSEVASMSHRLDKISPDSKEGGATKNGSGLLASSPLPATTVSPTASPIPVEQREVAAVHAQKSGFTSRIILT